MNVPRGDDLSTLRNKLNMLDSSAVQTRRRSQRFAAIENASHELIGAVMSPTTSSGVAAKREATRFPSVFFSKTPAAPRNNTTSSPLPGPKSTTTSYVSTRKSMIREGEEDSAASYQQKQHQVPFNRSSVASELYQSAASHMSTSTDDLSSLQNALKHLKSSSLATTNAPTVSIAPAVEPAAAAPGYVPLPKPSARRLSGIRPITSSSLDSLQQRVARMNMANAPSALHAKSATAIVASPKIERYSPVGLKKAPRAATPAKPTQPQQQQSVEEESHTPPMRSLPQTPGAPANTPASPLTRTLAAETQQLRQRYDASNSAGPSPAQIEAALAAKYENTAQNEQEDTKEEEEQPTTVVLHTTTTNAPTTAARPLDLENLPSEEVTVLMASPLPTILNNAATTTAAPTTAGARTEYDADEDVVMGDVDTPGTGNESLAALATTVPRRASYANTTEDNTVVNTMNSGGSSSGGVRTSSRFKIEALRQGVTPLRVRQHRASFSPSNAGVNVEIIESVVEKNINKVETVDSPTMSSNPLALQPAPPSAVASLGVAGGVSPPAASSNSGISNNPLFSGTPSHPTPPSITTRRASLSIAAAAGLRTPSTGGASAASEGMKLAGKLHAAAEKLQTPVSVTFTGNKKSISVPSDEDATFQFKGDVQALLQALDANTPTQEINKTSTPGGAISNIGMPTARALAAASTEERPKPVARRRSSLTASPNSGGAAILDLSGFDVNGERTAPGQGTPLLEPRNTTSANSHGTTRFALTPVAAAPLRPSSHSPEVASLRQQIADLEAERKDAASLLSGYQGTIAELEDRHSSAMIKLQAENAMLKSESERLRSDRAQIHSQFDTLYREKYAPLKTEAAALRRGADALKTRLAEEGGNGKRVAQLEAELSASQAATVAAQQGSAAFKAEIEAANEARRVAEQRAADAGARLQDAEQKWASKFAAESSRAEQSLAMKDKEVSALKDKLAAMAKQYDDAVHRALLAQAARERKAAEVQHKEEEICALQVDLQEHKHILGQYRAENDKFVAIRESYKAKIAALEKKLVEAEAAKEDALQLSEELLERVKMDEANKGR